MTEQIEVNRWVDMYYVIVMALTLFHMTYLGALRMACGLFGPTEMTTLSVLKTILMM